MVGKKDLIKSYMYETCGLSSCITRLKSIWEKGKAKTVEVVRCYKTINMEGKIVSKQFSRHKLNSAGRFCDI